jgi:AbrB family looped-hinge helix DNA binding protein
MKSPELPMVSIKTFVVGPRHDAHLPKNWLKKFGISEGDELTIFEDTSGRLIIVPAKASEAAR